MTNKNKDNDISELPLFSADWSKGEAKLEAHSNVVHMHHWRRASPKVDKPNDFVAAYINLAKKLDW